MTTGTLPPIVESITIDAPAENVFAALTDPEQLVQWWGDDETYRCGEMRVDLRPGGRWRTQGRGSDGTPFAVEGEYRIVQPPVLVEFTWQYDWGEGPQGTPTLVRYELSECAGKTQVTVRHSGFTVAEDREGHARGWKMVLGWLSAYVSPSRV